MESMGVGCEQHRRLQTMLFMEVNLVKCHWGSGKKWGRPLSREHGDMYTQVAHSSFSVLWARAQIHCGLHQWFGLSQAAFGVHCGADWGVKWWAAKHSLRGGDAVVEPFLKQFQIRLPFFSFLRFLYARMSLRRYGRLKNDIEIMKIL